jgi:hypothetical protein
MWVGGTEKAIAQAFAEAEGSDAILLLDEADSGVLVCFTNLLKNFDSAVLRRFAFKVVFQPLTREGHVTLFERYFPSVQLSAEARASLAALSMLTPGDLKAILSRMRRTADFNL